MFNNQLEIYELLTSGKMLIDTKQRTIYCFRDGVFMKCVNNKWSRSTCVFERCEDYAIYDEFAWEYNLQDNPILCWVDNFKSIALITHIEYEAEIKRYRSHSAYWYTATPVQINDISKYLYKIPT